MTSGVTVIANTEASDFMHTSNMRKTPLPQEVVIVTPSVNFKHHKFKVASIFNPPDPPALELTIILNEHDFNNRDVFTVTGQNNLAVGAH